MTDASTGEQELPSGRAARRRRARTKVGGAVAVTLVGALCGGWLWLGTPTPLVTVMSPSTEPTLGVGELALMAKVRGPPEVGDIVQVTVPREVQRDKGAPSTIVPRITPNNKRRGRTKGRHLEPPKPTNHP